MTYSATWTFALCRLKPGTDSLRLSCTSFLQKPDFGTNGGLSAAFGGLLTGMLGVGIGEVVIPQLVKKNGVPLPVAAGTSVLVVFLNAAGEPSYILSQEFYTARACDQASGVVVLNRPLRSHAV